MILELFNHHLMVPRRQVPNRPWDKFLNTHHLQLRLPSDVTMQSFQARANGKRRSVGETQRLLQALEDGEISLIRRSKSTIGATEASGSQITSPAVDAADTSQMVGKDDWVLDLEGDEDIEGRSAVDRSLERVDSVLGNNLSDDSDFEVTRVELTPSPASSLHSRS
jgi:hypothetical protein